MPQKSNKANIIITVVAIAIILGGVFILNQAISSNRDKSESESVTKVAPKKEPEPVEKKASESNFLPEPKTETLPNKEPLDSTQKEEIEENPTKETKEEKKTTNANLEKGQVALKVLSVGPANEKGLTPYQFEVVDSTFEDSKFFKSGATLNNVRLSGFSGATVGKTYRVAISFTETETTFSINSIVNLGEI
jgi:type IV secretory pathway VirB10-like protein